MSNREQWLRTALDAMRPWFAEAGHKVPDTIRVSVGFPKGRPGKGQIVGQCWSSDASDDGSNHIFVTPERDDAPGTLLTLLHETIHAIDDCKSGHKGEFIRIARDMGLVPPWTSSTAGPWLIVRIAELAESLGAFPHAKLNPLALTSGPKKQGTRMLKVTCPYDGYTIRTTQKWIEVGLPSCPCGTEMERAD